MTNIIGSTCIKLNNISGNYVANSKLANSKNDDFSKGILKQIENLNKQIEKINENKGLSGEEKASRVKNLKEQIEALNKQLIEKQLQEQKEEQEEQAKKVNDRNTSNSDNDEDMEMFLEANSTLKKVKLCETLKDRATASSRILRSEAKLDKLRDTTGSAAKIIEGKLTKANELEEKANNLAKEINCKLTKANKGSDKDKNNGTNDKKVEREYINQNDKDIMQKIDIYIKGIEKEKNKIDIIG